MSPSRRVFTISFVSFAVLLAGLVVLVVTRQSGTFTYAIDDPMIHLSIARNLARHATFGLTPGTYESASSSPVWVVLLTPFLAVAPRAWWLPLVLNIAAGAWVLVSFARLPVLQDAVEGALGRALVVVLPVGLGLVPLVLTGMEHTLHAALVAQLLWWFAQRYIGVWPRKTTVLWYSTVALGTLLRFETAFVAIGVVVAVYSIRGTRDGESRRGRFAIGTLAASLVPFAAFGLVNRLFGQYVLPNSIVAKTSVGSGLPIPRASDVVARAIADPLLVILVLSACIALWFTKGGSGDAAAWRPALVVMLVATALQITFADIGWFDRYQAYLVVGLFLGLLGLGPAIVGDDVERATRAVMLCLVVMMLRVATLVSAPAATYNVFENQYQLGRFLGKAYAGQAVAVNDIGYVSWEHDGELVDVAGLGSFDFVHARKTGELDSEFTATQLSEHGVEVLAVYDTVFGGLVPDGWIPTGNWCVSSPRVVLSADCVTFYAPPGPLAERLRTALDDYAPALPDGVTYSRVGTPGVP